MNSEFEHAWGKALHTVIAHLIRNAEKVPEATLAAGLDVENFTWPKLPEAEKRERLAAVVRETAAGSPIEKHFAEYPHAFSRDRYADYRAALDKYLASF